jgi:hypothetical protein
MVSLKSTRVSQRTAHHRFGVNGMLQMAHSSVDAKKSKHWRRLSGIIALS